MGQIPWLEVLALNNIRVFYNKMSRAKYISHLDITRCMQRAIKRAAIPVWYTEGFNPHIYMTFALPLSLGYESECEVMDIRLVEDMPLDEVVDRLNQALPPDLKVTAVKAQINKLDAIAAALYKVTFSAESIDGEKLLQDFGEFLLCDKIEVEKRTKKGVKTVDIKPDCEIIKIYAGKNSIVMRIKTAAGIEKNINPSLLTDEFAQRYKLENYTTAVLRKAVYMQDGQDFC